MDCKSITVKYLNGFKLNKIHTIGDGSCYFHAILMAISLDYRESDASKRSKLAKQFRIAFSEILTDKDENGVMLYNKLSRGKLEDYSKGVTSATLNNMIKELKSNNPVDNKYHELVSDELSKDIYIIDEITGNIYNLGSKSIYYKNRDSILLLYNELMCHFELLSLEDEDGYIRTLFDTNHELINKCKELLI